MYQFVAKFHFFDFMTKILIFHTEQCMCPLQFYHHTMFILTMFFQWFVLFHNTQSNDARFMHKLSKYAYII